MLFHSYNTEPESELELELELEPERSDSLHAYLLSIFFYVKMLCISLNTQAYISYENKYHLY